MSLSARSGTGGGEGPDAAWSADSDHRWYNAGYSRPSAPPNADDHSAGPGRSRLAPDGGRREAAFPLLGALRTIRMASKTSMEHKVVARRLDDSSWTTDCAALAKAADDMAAEGWTLVSLAVPNNRWALLAFARPKRDA